MDDLGEDDLSSHGVNHEEGGQQSNIHISDVIAAIQNADPSFEATVQQIGSEMFSGGNNIAGPLQPSPQSQPQASQVRRTNAYVKIVEQPASKSLRFRYECEGRSAGSIPGVHSTPENKTYPTIEIVGYKGRAVVVVSCVTKDEPYKAHPHNLVGKDGCRRGVCTVEINSESMCVSFSNLGIQCVKRKDIEDALRVREEIRVDPFKKGFAHRSQPTSIDLNAVRLCFQVFLEEKGRFAIPLKPVVSDIIYDKKAMSELVICKMSHCSAPVAGGREIILLCEKVAKEDISIRFYEEIDGQTVWEGWGDFQHANVHKQVAIAFRSPTYKYLEVDQPVKVWIHLRRPSDGAVSEPLPFELLPLDSGRAGLLSRRRRTDYSLIKQILATDANCKAPKSVQRDISIDSSIISSAIIDGNNNSNEANNPSLSAIIGRNIQEDITVDLTTPTEELNKIERSQVHTASPNKTVPNHDRNLNELLDQVAELDQIYSDNQTRLQGMDVDSNVRGMSMDIDDFDERNTYTSLQLAFRNPVPITENEFSYEDVITQKGPIIEFSPLKRDTEEKLPPLPPKRIKKAPSVEVLRPRAQTLSSTVDEKVTKVENNRNSQTVPTPQKLPKSPVTRSVDRLPGDLPAIPPKKRSFLSRIFNRKSKEKSPIRSASDGKPLKPVGRSASSISGQRPTKFKQDVTHSSLKGSSGNLSLGASLRYTDSITHISLHGDDNRNTSSPSLNNNHLPPTDGDTILVAENVLAIDAAALKKLQDNLDLTEAEHYALYMALAPHATVSEFDELSCYYSPVEGDPIELKRKRQKTAEGPNEYLRRLQAQPPPIHDIATIDPLTQPQMYHNINMFEIPPAQAQVIKTEPSEQVPSPYGGAIGVIHYDMRQPMQATPSPQPYGTPSPPPNYRLEEWGHTPLMPVQPVPMQQRHAMNIPQEPQATVNLFDMDTQLQFNNNSDLLESLLNNNAYQPNILGDSHDVDRNMSDSFTRMTMNVFNELAPSSSNVTANGGGGPN